MNVLWMSKQERLTVDAATDPVLSSVAVIQLQDVALDGVPGGRHHPPRQGGAVIPGAAFLQLQQGRSGHGWSRIHWKERGAW